MHHLGASPKVGLEPLGPNTCQDEESSGMGAQCCPRVPLANINRWAETDGLQILVASTFFADDMMMMMEPNLFQGDEGPRQICLSQWPGW